MLTETECCVRTSLEFLGCLLCQVLVMQPCPGVVFFCGRGAVCGCSVSARRLCGLVAPSVRQQSNVCHSLRDHLPGVSDTLVPEPSTPLRQREDTFTVHEQFLSLPLTSDFDRKRLCASQSRIVPSMRHAQLDLCGS